MNTKIYFSALNSIIIIALLLILSSCKKENPIEVDNGFYGITETNANGDLIGDIDSDDWLQQFNYSPNDTTPAIVVFSVKPAYPNPTERFTTVSFALPTNDSVKVWLEDRPEGKDTTILSSYLIAGQYQLLIDLNYGNDLLNRKEGLLRLHIEVPTRKVIPKVHGDVEYKKP